MKFCRRPCDIGFSTPVANFLQCIHVPEIYESWLAVVKNIANVTLDMILGVEDILISWFVIILALLYRRCFVICMLYDSL